MRVQFHRGLLRGIVASSRTWRSALAACLLALWLSPLALADPAVHGSLWGMGLGGNGQLGNGALDNHSTAIEILPAGVTEISAGAAHSLLLMADSSLWAMGSNVVGQLGDGSNTGSLVPLKVVDSGVIAIAAGGYHSLFIRDDGSLWAMGYNLNGELGDGSTTHRNSPVKIVDDGVIAIAGGTNHSLFLRDDGSLWAMGGNWAGQLGDGSTTTQLSPIQIVNAGVAAIDASYGHSLFLKDDSSLWGMGFNASGPLGIGNTDNQSSPIQIVASGVALLAAGDQHTLFVRDDGSLWAMGGNWDGQLGDGTTDDRHSPVQILASGVAAIAANTHSLFVLNDGSLWATGANWAGQLGDGGTVNIQTPVQVVASGVIAISAGEHHSLYLGPVSPSAATLVSVANAANAAEPAIDGAFTLTRVGDLAGPLTVNFTITGDATAGADYQTMPTTVTFAAGSATATVAVTVIDDLLVEANETVILTLGPGTGYTVGSPASATVTITSEDLVAEDPPVVTVAADPGHAAEPSVNGSFLLSRTGTVGAPLTVSLAVAGTATAGADYQTILTAVTFAAGSATASVAVTVMDDLLVEANETVILALAPGIGYTVGTAASAILLIINDDGTTLAGMGYNFHGQLGDGGNSDQHYPIEILADGVKAIAAGEHHSLYLTTDGALWGMGNNFHGVLGDGTTDNRHSPVQIVAGGVIAVAAGLNHSLFIKDDGSLWAMGSNTLGQLGDGTTNNRLSPVQIVSGGVVAVAAGNFHSLFLLADGSLWAMGQNGAGQLGDGTTNDRHSPVQVLSGGVSAVDAGAVHSLVIKQDTSLWAMGLNTLGQLGDGSTTHRHSPVVIETSGVVTASGGNFHSVFVKSDGSLWGMGHDGFGQLGDGDIATKFSPVTGLVAAVTSVAAGVMQSLLIRADGSLWSMGLNTYGQLGDGSTTDLLLPAQIVPSNVVAVAAGDYHTLYLGPVPVIPDPVVTVVADNPNAAEPSTHGNFQLSRSHSSTLALTVNLTVSGTATPGDDYVSLPTMVTFAAGSATASVAVTVIDDLLVEGDETVVLTLVAGTGYVLGSPASATVTLTSEDLVPEDPPVVTLAADLAEAAEPSVNGSFLLSRTGTVGTPLTVSLAVAGTATAGADYQTMAGTVTFAVGSATASVAVTVIDDLLVEGDETVILTLVAGTGYTVGSPASATVTISSDDNDGLPKLFQVTPGDTGLGRFLMIIGENLTLHRIRAVVLVEVNLLAKRPRRVPLQITRSSVTDHSLTVKVRSGKLGVYDLELFFRGVREPLRLANAVTLRAPEISMLDRDTVRQGGVVGVSGEFFGGYKGQVILTTLDGKKRLRLKVMRDDWQDSQIMAQVARRAKLGAYTLSVRTRLGTVDAPGTLTVIARE